MSSRYFDYAPPDSGPEGEAFEDDATVAIDRAMLSSLGQLSSSGHLAPTASRPAAPTNGPGHEWYVANRGVQTGPFTTGELASKIAAGAVPTDATVWREGLTDWEDIGWIPELRPPPPPKSTIVPPPPSEVRRAPETLSPLEKVAFAPQPLPLPRMGRWILSPWHAMIGAVLLGMGVSFVALKLVSAEAEGDFSRAPVLAVRGQPALAASLQTAQGAVLDPERVRTAIAPYLDRTRDECWRQARETREPDAPPDASLEVAIQVDAAGHVLGSQSRGNPKGYPGLGDCVAARTRGWSFPSAANPSTVTLAFVFKKD